MILVTGGAGFIGSNIVQALVKQGHSVSVVDTVGTTCKWMNLQQTAVWRWYQPHQLEAALAAKPSAVIHMGAISNTTAQDGDAILHNNFSTSQMIWDWCCHHNRPFIYASSASTYGDGKLGFDDDHLQIAKLKPRNLYAWSKHLFDQFVLNQTWRRWPVNNQWVGLKFFNVYGPGEHHKGSQSSVILQQWQRLSLNQRVKLFKSTAQDLEDGEQKRDFVYVADVVDVVLWFLNNPKLNGIFNVGSGTANSFNSVMQQLLKHSAVEQKWPVDYVNMPDELVAHYQNYTCAPIAKLRSVGYTKPMTDLDKGVEAYVQWLKHNQL